MKDLKSQEMKLIEKLDKYGLVRVIKHEKFEMPIHQEAFGMTLPKHMHESKANHIIAMTTIFLYEKDVWVAKRKARNDDTEGYVSIGRAYCSEMEKHHSRAKGRLIATGRALKNFETTFA